MSKNLYIKILTPNPSVSNWNTEIIVNYEVFESDETEFSDKYTEFLRTYPTKTYEDFLESSEFSSISTKLNNFPNPTEYPILVEETIISKSYYDVSVNSSEFGKLKITYNLLDSSLSSEKLYILNIKLNFGNFYKNILINKDVLDLELSDSNVKTITKNQIDNFVIEPIFKDGKLFENFSNDYNLYIFVKDHNDLSVNYDLDNNIFLWLNLLDFPIKTFEISLTLHHKNIPGYIQTKIITLNVEKFLTEKVFIEKYDNVNFVRNNSSGKFSRVEITIDNTKDNFIILK